VIVGASTGESDLGARSTDLYLYNQSVVEKTVTMTYYPDGNPEGSVTQQVTLQPGQGLVLEDVVETLFGQTDSRGAIHLDASSSDSVITSAATFVDNDRGRFGSLVPAVTSSDATGVADAPLQILQLRSSSSQTTDLGIAEVTGSDATVEVTALAPGSLSAASIQIPMKANEYRQISSVLDQMGLSTTHNARLSVRVVSGGGKVTSFAALADQATGDEIVIPGQ
jgi:hypothetical protein